MRRRDKLKDETNRLSHLRSEFHPVNSAYNLQVPQRGAAGRAAEEPSQMKVAPIDAQGCGMGRYQRAGQTFSLEIEEGQRKLHPQHYWKPR